MYLFNLLMFECWESWSLHWQFTQELSLVLQIFVSGRYVNASRILVLISQSHIIGSTLLTFAAWFQRYATRFRHRIWFDIWKKDQLRITQFKIDVSSRTRLVQKRPHNAYSWRSFNTVLSSLVPTHQFFVLKIKRTEWPLFWKSFLVGSLNMSLRTLLRQRYH